MIPLPTQLVAVTVYPDRARLSRQGSLSLEAGSHSLEIPDLPLQLNPDSVRARARGTARSRLLGVQVERRFFTETPAEAVRQLEAEVETLQDESSRLDARVEAAKHYRTVLDLLSGHTETYATALAAGEIGVAEQLAQFEGLRAHSEKLSAELLDLAGRKRELERRLQKAQNELKRQQNARPRERYTAIVEVELLEAGSLEVEISYVISGASWKPLYDLRLLEEGAAPTLAVGYLAQVSQQSGEAWENVSLALSTARPALAGRLPELDPWYVRPLPPMPMVAAARAPQAKMRSMALPQAQSFAAETLAAAPMMHEAEEVTAHVEASGAAVTYGVPGVVSIPADGAPHKVTVAHFSLAPRLDYVAAPKLVQAAYRRAKVANDSPYLLLAGAVNLFAGEEFIGATQIELTPPQGEIELYLGVDDRIRVERELKRRDVGKIILGGKRRLQYGYEITLENLLATPARITLHDQLPVAQHEDIKVRLESADPKPSEQTELNLLNWELTLAPKEKRTLRFDFSLEFPQHMEVIGLP